MRTVLAFVLLVTATGCVSSETYRGHAFVPRPRHYRVRYLPGEEDARRILPAGWRVRDHRVDGQGRPTWPFDGREDRVPVALDLDEDRRPDMRGHALRYDLRYEHDEDGAQIVGLTLPVEPRVGRRALAMLVHQLVDGVFGEGFVEVVSERARAFETRVVDEYEAEVGGAPAHLVTIELAQSIPGRGVAWGRGTTLTLVLARPPLRWRPGSRASEDGAPMLVLWMLEARSETYARHRGAFDSLLDRVDVRSE